MSIFTMSIVNSFCCLFVLREMGLLIYSQGWTETHSVDQARLELTEILLPLSLSAGTKGVHAPPHLAAVVFSYCVSVSTREIKA